MIRQLIIFGFSVVLLSCASQDPLTPLEDKGPKLEQLQETPAFKKIKGLLAGLGYEGVGLQYESEGTLDFLSQLFADSRVGNRKIKLVYTGIALAYDPRYESFTVGNERNLEKTMLFIVKNIPNRKK